MGKYVKGGKVGAFVGAIELLLFFFLFLIMTIFFVKFSITPGFELSAPSVDSLVFLSIVFILEGVVLGGMGVLIFGFLFDYLPSDDPLRKGIVFGILLGFLTTCVPYLIGTENLLVPLVFFLIPFFWGSATGKLWDRFSN